MTYPYETFYRCTWETREPVNSIHGDWRLNDSCDQAFESFMKEDSRVKIASLNMYRVDVRISKTVDFYRSNEPLDPKIAALKAKRFMNCGSSCVDSEPSLWERFWYLK